MNKAMRTKELNRLRAQALKQGAYLMSVIYRVQQDLGEDVRLNPTDLHRGEWMNFHMTLGEAYEDFVKLIVEAAKFCESQPEVPGLTRKWRSSEIVRKEHKTKREKWLESKWIQHK